MLGQLRRERDQPRSAGLDVRLCVVQSFQLRVAVRSPLPAEERQHERPGAQGVGRATTNAVVTASILILAANYVLTSLLFTE